MRLLALLLLGLNLCAATVKLRVGQRVVELPLDQYVAAVLAGEASVFQSDEALKAMAIVARTYAVREKGRHAAEGFDFCTTTHCQRADVDGVTARLEKIAASTAGEMLWYRGRLAFTPYSLDCGGRTEDAGEVWPNEKAAYLSSHADEYCVRAGGGHWRWSASGEAIAAALRKQGLRAPERISDIRITERTIGGRARELDLGGVRIAASAFRFATGRELGWNTLRSDWFDVQGLRFVGRGSGHGVGLCQRGAEQMGIEGHTYREILAYYFPGTEIGGSARGFDWTRLGGEGISLYTTQAGRDRGLLAAAERALKSDLGRSGWTPGRELEIRVYPDVAAFRDATGEPGWVAGYAHGGRIELQPGAQAESTLRHEIWHVLVEGQAKPGLPLWFREGLVEYLSGHTAAVAAAPGQGLDDALRETHDAARARRAYDEAAGAVTGLAQRYGETALFRWVKSGMPSSISNPPAKSK